MRRQKPFVLNRVATKACELLDNLRSIGFSSWRGRMRRLTGVRSYYRTLSIELLEVREVMTSDMPLPTSDLSAIGLFATTERIEPPKQSPSQFVIDKASLGGDLDQYTSRSGGPLKINIAPTRYIGDRDKLLANGLIPSSIKLTFPAFDVDAQATGAKPEVDKLSFIDADGVEHDLQQSLVGDNDLWQDNSVTIPTAWLDFGKLNRSGPDSVGAFQRGESYLKVDIDTLDGGWLVEIDWVSYELEAPEPVMFVHGIMSNPATWNIEDPTTGDRALPGPFLTRLDTAGIPYFLAGVGMTDSIQNNALKLESYYQSLQANWSKDWDQHFRVDLITHSHGGLDAREWVEHRDRVDQLFQLGTPNGGSPIADRIQQGILRLPGIIGPGAAAAGAYFAPTGYQLTTVYMAWYNYTHGFNPDVAYTVYGGDYKDTASGWGAVDLALAGLLGGPNDQIVPLWSAFDVDASKVRFYTSGDQGNEQAKHVNMTTSEQLAANIIPQLFHKTSTKPMTTTAATSQAVAAMLSTNATLSVASGFQPPPMGASNDPASAINLIGQDETRFERLVVDDTKGIVQFQLTYELGDLDFELISPSGVAYSQAVVGAGRSDVSFAKQIEIPGLIQKAFRFAPGAEKGEWQVRVIGSKLPAGAASAIYLVDVMQEKSKITLEVAGSEADGAVSAGEPFTITAKLRNGAAAVKDATISGELRAADGTLVPIRFHDDGLDGDAKRNDGIYTARISQSLPPGLYVASVLAQGSSVLPFEREGFAQVAVAAVGASVSTATATRIDANNNGMVDVLRADFRVTAAAPGTYRVTATLADPTGKVVETVSAVAQLNAGTNTVRLEFDGEKIYARKKDGVFTLRDVMLEQEVGGIFAAAYKKVGVQASLGEFRFNDFEHVRISLGKGGKIAAIDADRDKFIDVLKFTVPVVTETAGNHTVSASLVDRNGAIVAVASVKQMLKAGKNNLVLEFDGKAIFNSRLDGPYRLQGVLIDGPSGVLRADTNITTAEYSAAGFETGRTLTTATLRATLPSVSGAPIDEIVVAFSRPIANGGFSIDDLVLRQGRNVISLPASVTIVRLDSTHYAVRGLSTAASVKGAYKLEMIGRQVRDVDGFSLYDLIATTWRVTR